MKRFIILVALLLNLYSVSIMGQEKKPNTLSFSSTQIKAVVDSLNKALLKNYVFLTKRLA